LSFDRLGLQQGHGLWPEQYLVGKTQKENVLRTILSPKSFVLRTFFPSVGVCDFLEHFFFGHFYMEKMEFCELAFFRAVSFSKQIVLRTFRFLKKSF